MKAAFKYLPLLLTVTLYTSTTHAAPTPGHFIIGAEGTFGGDELGATYDNNGNELDELTAGGLIHLYGGYDFLLSNDPYNSLSLRTSFGWHFDSVSADNGEVYFDRYPLNFILHQQFDNIDLGAGFTYHLNPTLDQSDVGQGKIKFDDALGFRIELGFPLNEQTDITLSVTAIDYKIDNSDGLSGNNIGIGLRLGF
jgi:hypothetical protein